jgi:Putative restriction endonuclease
VLKLQGPGLDLSLFQALVKTLDQGMPGDMRLWMPYSAKRESSQRTF